MKVVIVAGQPATGKTAVILKTIDHLKRINKLPSVAKMDCLKSNDEILYKEIGVPVVTGLSEHLCPDHYLATNLNHLFDWANSNHSELLIIETAGLCNRCAPFLTGALNLCIIDSTSSIKSPEKLGPMVTTADIITLTKCDMISQAEREILKSHLRELNPSANILIINGITGAGTKALSKLCIATDSITDISEQSLVYEMPGAICSYCVGETRIGKEYHQGMVNYMEVIS